MIPMNKSTTALLCMDCQNAIVAGIAGSQPDFLPRAAATLAAARAAGIQVIYIQVAFRPGLPEISPRNKLFSALKTDPARAQMFAGEGAAIHPAVAPQDGDIIVVKHRVSAITGTDLEMILRAKGIENLVLFGLATSGVVLSTLVGTVDLDYNVTVLSDLCGDRDPELHTALMTKYFVSRGEVITAEAFRSQL